jgi:hypothetical protein
LSQYNNNINKKLLSVATNQMILSVTVLRDVQTGEPAKKKKLNITRNGKQRIRKNVYRIGSKSMGMNGLLIG